MSAAPEAFAARASGLRDGRPPADSWATAFGDAVDVFAARTDRDVQVLAVRPDVTPAQRRAFERARSEWLAHEDAAVIVSVRAHGDQPRPWLAIDPSTDSTAERLGPQAVRSIMIDLAEGGWLIESVGRSTQLTRGQFRLDPTTATAQLCWPLQSHQSDTVERIGTLGYELLTGAELPANRPLSWPGDGAVPPLWETIQATLTDAPPSCYELKRALLFGPATPPAESGQGPPTEPDPTTPADTNSPTRTPSERISRRAAVGVLGLGALGVTGFLARGGTTTPDANTEQDTPPEASFRFEQGRTTLTVIHDGGDQIEAGRLSVRNPRTSGTGTYRWSEYEGYDEETLVSEGDAIVIDRRVLSMWHADVVWQSPTGETKLLEERDITEEGWYSSGTQR